MDSLLRIENLRVEAKVGPGRFAPIVRDVSFTVAPGEVLALIGESGSGKTTIALSALGYSRPGCRIANGRVFLEDTDVLALDRETLRKLRGRRVSYLAQSAAAYVPETTSGLAYAVERFRHWDHAGHVTLARGERSRLADFATKAL